MGRKIPGRKHRGVRDPEKQRAQRLLLQKVNAPPTDIDDQPVPKSVQRIAELMNKVRNPPKIDKKPPSTIKKQKTKKKLIVIETKVDRNEKTVPRFIQQKGESDRAFLNRCNRICEDVKREVDFEAKFGVEVKRNPVTGKIENTLSNKKDDPIKQMIKDAKKEKKQKKKKKNSETVKLTKGEKRKLKVKLKKEEKMEGVHDFESAEIVKFGEVNHAPPVLTVPRKVQQKNEAARPGRKNLLLKSIINGDVMPQVGNPKSKSESILKKVSKKSIDKKGKRKDLPIKLRNQLDRDQKEIIEAYRTMKAGKRKNL